MARSRKGPPHQAKHFQPEDHAHAAHQEEAAHGHAPKPGPVIPGVAKGPARKTSHPMERTPKGPSRGQ
jgi:hypothetical protein